MKKIAKLVIFLSLIIVLSSCATNEEAGMTLKDSEIHENSEFCSVMVAEDFLSQFVSIFFGPYGDEPAFGVADNRDGGFWDPYVIDGYGNHVYDVPFVQAVEVEFNHGTSTALASHFRLFAAYGSSLPQVIAIQFEAFNFSGGGYTLYEFANDGSEFLQLGSLTAYHHGGAGHDAVNLVPFISELGNIIIYTRIDDGFFRAINHEGNFEFVASVWATTRYVSGDTIHIRTEDENGVGRTEHFTWEEFKELLSANQMQTFFPNFPDGSFVPMVRMYDLEQELTERITERLRGTFPIVERSAPSP